MTAIHVRAFRGEVPRTSERLIGEHFAQMARNCRLSSGKLEPLRLPALAARVSGVDGSMRTIHQAVFGERRVWLSWNVPVNVLPSLVAEDALGRMYFSSPDFEPRMTTWAHGIDGQSEPYPGRYFALGVLPPAGELSVTAGEGEQVDESRAYVCTYKTRYHEESGTGSPAVVTGAADAPYTLSGFGLLPVNESAIQSVVGNGSRLSVVSALPLRGLAVGDCVALSGLPGVNGEYRVVEVAADDQRFVVECGYAGTLNGGLWRRSAPFNLEGMTVQVYRSQKRDATYRLVGEIAADAAQTGTFTDNLTASELAVQPVLESLITRRPPRFLKHVIALPNGCHVGLNGNELCFSEMYQPHSYPTDYRYQITATCVALVAVGNSVIVLCADDFHFLATSSTPDVVSISKIEADRFAPCITADGVVDIGRGALYPSHDGLYLAHAGGVRNVTQSLYKRQQWSAFNPVSFQAAEHDGFYYAIYQHSDAAGNRAALFVLDINEPDSVVVIDYALDGLFANPTDGRLYMAMDGAVYSWDALSGWLMAALWRSREYQLPVPVNMATAQVYADYGANNQVDQQAFKLNTWLLERAYRPAGRLGGHAFGRMAVNGSRLQPTLPPVLNRVTFRLLVHDKVVFEKVVTSDSPFMLPGGYKADVLAFELETNIAVHSVSIAETMRELRQV